MTQPIPPDFVIPELRPAEPADPGGRLADAAPDAGPSTAPTAPTTIANR